MSNTIEVRDKVWGPGVTPTSQTLLAVGGGGVGGGGGGGWNGGGEGRVTGEGPDETAASSTSEPQAPAPWTPDADRFPTPEEIQAMKAADLTAVDETFDLGIGKMKVDDKRVAVATGIEDLIVELAGLEGLTAEDIAALDAAD